MNQIEEFQERRTSADIVFDYLYEQIVTLGLLPGTKISEAEIASKFGVSRQPVRDAFSRLGNHDLLLVRPQKATVVKKFSIRTIEAARFGRLAVELEVLHKAVQVWDGSFMPAFKRNLDLQQKALDHKDADGFHQQDYAFHKLLCDAADCAFAFEIIAANKAQVDRLCVLSLMASDSMTELVDDHIQIVDQLDKRDDIGLNATIRKHLSRLDGTIEDVHRKHASFFED